MYDRRSLALGAKTEQYRPIAVLGWTVEATESLVKHMVDAPIDGFLGEIIARGEPLRGVNMNDPRIIDLVRRCKEAHP